jgi:very-short-patch-repair endonuclease
MDDRPILFSRKISRKKIERSKTFRHAMTESERIIWNHLRAHRFRGLHFRRQAVIGPFIVVFYCHLLRLVVEIDGVVHKTQKEMDDERDFFLKAMGLRVVRFPNSRVMINLKDVLADLDVVCGGLEKR